MPTQKIAKIIVKNILRKTPSATSWIFSFLLDMGALTIDAFLSPSYYADLPSASSAFSNIPRKRPEIKPVTIRQSILRLRKQGFVEKRGDQYKLTEKGKQLGKYILERKTLINKKWDAKYRIVIFDIPEEKKEQRSWLRQELYLLEYRLLQESVFIGKHPLPKSLIKSIKQRRIGNCINYILAEKVYKNII